jgi:hypothetical protein
MTNLFAGSCIKYPKLRAFRWNKIISISNEIDSIHFNFYSQDLKLVYLTVYVILHYLYFLKDVPTLISYIPLDTTTLNLDHKMAKILTRHQ